jgi:hypothetical protein
VSTVSSTEPVLGGAVDENLPLFLAKVAAHVRQAVVVDLTVR